MSDEDFSYKRPGQQVRSAKLQKYSAPALEKGLEIIEFLAEQQDPKSLQQIASGVNRSKNEIFRMMIVLEESGYIDRQDTDSFILSDKLYHLGLRRPANKRVTDVALPLMQEFTDSYPFCSYLAVPSGMHSVIIAKSESSVPLGLSVTVGHRTPMDSSAEGLCFLAHASEHRRTQILKKLGHDAEKIDQILDTLGDLRQRKESEVASPFLAGVRHLAMPIFETVGHSAMAAIGVQFVDLQTRPVPFEVIKRELHLLTDTINLAISSSI